MNMFDSIEVKIIELMNSNETGMTSGEILKALTLDLNDLKNRKEIIKLLYGWHQAGILVCTTRRTDYKDIISYNQEYHLNMGKAFVTDIVKMIYAYHSKKHPKNESFDIMKARHDKEIEELQENCKHEKLSDWLDEWWAMGHSTGFQVKICKFCSKKIKRMTGCHVCHKMTEDPWDGDGSHKTPYGNHYCPKCAKKLGIKNKKLGGKK